MTTFTRYLAAAAAVGGLSAPLAAQNYGYQQPYQQPAYPQQNYPGYGQQVYGQQQGYGRSTGNPITDVIDQLLGNRYNVSDRQAVRRCGAAAVTKAEGQFRTQFRGRRSHAYPGYPGFVQIVAITDVQRRLTGVRVRGLLDTGGNGYGRGRGGADVSFRCEVDRRGRVDTVRLERNPYYRPR